jgi:hypothetical protein
MGSWGLTPTVSDSEGLTKPYLKVDHDNDDEDGI